MKKVKAFYELSTLADSDIDQIFKYTLNEFGLKQAIKYTSEFHEFYEHLLWNPTLGKKRFEINDELYSLSKNEHIIFYIIQMNSIKIVRVLHGSRDFPKHFK